jgi:hypothetical protein
MSEKNDDLIRSTVPMPAGHSWKCKPGNNLFVAERGACSFEIPEKWVIEHDGKQTVSIHDLAPPKDSCRIALTIFHLPPVQGGWSQLPLANLYERICQLDDQQKQRKDLPQSLALHTETRPDLELLWADKGDWPDPENGKPIHCRQLMARARLVQVLITFDVYREFEEKFEPAWNDLLATLRVAVPRDLAGRVGN